MALQAFTDVFVRPGNSVRGHFTLRLVGPGRVWIALRSAQDQAFRGGYLGGYSIQNVPLGQSGGVGYLSPGTLEYGLQRGSWVAFNDRGTYLANYAPGQTVDLFWSINQEAGLLNLSVLPGGVTQERIPATTAGVANTPLRRLSI